MREVHLATCTFNLMMTRPRETILRTIPLSIRLGQYDNDVDKSSTLIDKYKDLTIVINYK